MEEIPERRCDVLVIGGGIAGLWCAYHAAPKGEVVVLNKGSFEEANTFWAQGGNGSSVSAVRCTRKALCRYCDCREQVCATKTPFGFW
jgi:aspartate oxidase